MSKRVVLAVLVAGFAVASAVPAWSAGDPARAKQWALSRIQATKAWQTSKGAGVTIAIVDTGIDLDHPDLRGKIAGHYTCIGGSCKSGGQDDNGHGSHVAGVAAASTDNGIGISGVAPAAKLMAVKVLKSDGSGDCNDIKLGIEFAVNHGARVINLSLGPETSLLDLIFGDQCSPLIEQGASYAFNKGAVVVAAAGNDSIKSAYSSSALEVVGATGPQDEVAGYSNTGADVYAPGGDASDPSNCSASTCIYSTWLNGYAVVEGTSMAAPHVSGVAALLISMGYTNVQAMRRINSTADSVSGILRLDAARAVGPPPAPKPSATHASSSSSPTSTASHATTSKTASASPKPSPKKPKVLAVTPTHTQSASTQAAGTPATRTGSSRALPIGIASGLLGAAVIAGVITAKRVRASRSA